MKPKTKLLYILVILALITAVPVLIFKVHQIYDTDEKQYEWAWRIKLPYDFAEKAYYTSEHGFHGDGRRYTVFKSGIKNAALSIHPASGPGMGKISVLTGDSADGRDEDIERFVREVAANLEVSDEDQPVFDELYIWKTLTKDDSDRLVVLCFPDSGLVFFAEELI